MSSLHTRPSSRHFSISPVPPYITRVSTHHVQEEGTYMFDGYAECQCHRHQCYAAQILPFLQSFAFIYNYSILTFHVPGSPCDCLGRRMSSATAAALGHTRRGCAGLGSSAAACACTCARRAAGRETSGSYRRAALPNGLPSMRSSSGNVCGILMESFCGKHRLQSA